VKVDRCAKTVGKITVERDCPRTLSCGVVASLGRAVGKTGLQKDILSFWNLLMSLDLSTKR